MNETLQFRKLEGVDLEYGNSFLKLKPKNTPKKAILVPQLKFLKIYMKLWILRNSRVLLSNMTKVFFQIPPQNTKVRQFWSRTERCFLQETFQFAGVDSIIEKLFQGSCWSKLLK